MNLKNTWVIVLAVFVAFSLNTGVFAGDPDPPGPPDSTASYTLADLYLRMTTGAAGTPSVFTEPASGPATSTMFTVDQIMGMAPAVDDTDGSTAAYVLTGLTFWGLSSGEWGPQIGTMPDNGAEDFTPTTTPQTISAGYHNGSGVVAGDGDLIAGNIKSGADIFGVAGSLAGCYGTVGAGWNNCSSTCSCQAGLVCVDLRVDLLFGNDSLQECLLTLYPPPGLPQRVKKCLNWASLSADITADYECQQSFGDGNNPYEYIIPLH